VDSQPRCSREPASISRFSVLRRPATAVRHGAWATSTSTRAWSRRPSRSSTATTSTGSSPVLSQDSIWPIFLPFPHPPRPSHCRAATPPAAPHSSWPKSLGSAGRRGFDEGQLNENGSCRCGCWPGEHETAGGDALSLPGSSFAGRGSACVTCTALRARAQEQRDQNSSE
jgi:hypothetical protein